MTKKKILRIRILLVDRMAIGCGSPSYSHPPITVPYPEKSSWWRHHITCYCNYLSLACLLLSTRNFRLTNPRWAFGSGPGGRGVTPDDDFTSDDDSEFVFRFDPSDGNGFGDLFSASLSRSPFSVPFWMKVLHNCDVTMTRLNSEKFQNFHFWAEIAKMVTRVNLPKSVNSC